MKAGTAFALSIGMLSLLFLAGFILMAFSSSKTLFMMGIFIVEVTFIIAALVLSYLIEKYDFLWL